MTLGEQITRLRKQNKYSQSALGKLVGTSGDIIGRYERNEVSPSIEVVIKIADVLGISIDYLVGKTSLELDQKTLTRIEEISGLPAGAKDQIYLVIDALIRDFKAKQTYA